MRTIKATILRHAETGQGEYQTYLVSVGDDEQISVMNLLEEIYEKLDHSLSFFSHAACRQATCGMCMGKVDGKVKLACKENVLNDSITIEPYSKNVVKDLICKN